MIRTGGPIATVQAIRTAEAVVADWAAGDYLAVQAQVPECLTDVDPMTWAVTVQAFKNPGERVLDAASRLSLYLALHAEVAGRPPRLSAVQVEAISRREA